MFLAVLTDGETPGWLPSKGVINRTWEAAASALTPCWGCLPGPRSRGLCFPFTPRYSCSLPWPFPAGKHAPHEMANQSVPVFHPAPPLATLPLCLIPPFPLPKHTVTATVMDPFTEWYRCRRPPSLSPTLSVSAVYVQVIFCFESLQRKLMWPWRECLCLFRPEGRRMLFESLVFHVTNRQEALWMTFFFFFDQSLQPSGWAWMHQALESENGVLQVKGRRALWQGCVVCLWCSWLDTRSSPWLGHLFRHTLSHLVLGDWDTITFSLHGAMMPGHQKTSIF